MSDDLITGGEAAHILDVSHTYINVLAKKGKLIPVTSIRKGRWMVRIYRRSDVERLADERLAST